MDLARPSIWLLITGAALLAGGCARVESLSQVDASGSLERKVTMRVAQMGMDEDPKTLPSNLITLQGQPAWKVTTSKDGTDSILEASRTLAPGDSESGSFTVTNGSSSKARCQVKAVKRDDGTIEYTETWIWEGKQSPPITGVLNEAGRESLKKHLTPLGAAEADLAAIEASVGRDLKRAVLGPGEPMLMILLTDPSLGLRKIRAKMVGYLESAIVKRLPDTDPGARKKAVLAIVTETATELDKKRTATADSAQGPESSGMLLSFSLAVQGPGQVIETNGEVDPVDGRVYWSMFLDAVEGENLVLRAVFKP
jgi:hypothetical protein